MKKLINKLRGKFAPPPQYLDSPTEEGFLLWPDGTNAPVEKVRMTDNGRLVTGIHRSSIMYYPAVGDRVTGAAVIIAPGGSHRELWIDHEGHVPAKWLSERGVHAFVLKYRLGREGGSPYSVEKHAVADILRATRLVRSRAGEWGIDENRVGVMGFSAGGELAAFAAMRYEKPPLTVGDAIDKKSSRPDFQVLVYPADPNGYIVKRQSPPAFICCGFEDCADIAIESAKLLVRFKEQGVAAEMHFYAHVGHGFGMRADNKGSVADWPQRLYDWMGDSGFLKGR
jgi:acetyl esterase/lipase